MRWKTWIPEYGLQLVFAIVAMVVGFVCDMFLDRFYYAAPFRQLAIFSVVAAAVSGYFVARYRRRTGGVFVWTAGLILFLYTASFLARTWNADWAPTPRLRYVWDSLFGPACTSQECVYTLPTDVFLGTVAYSIASKIALISLGRTNEEVTGSKEASCCAPASI